MRIKKTNLVCVCFASLFFFSQQGVVADELQPTLDPQKARCEERTDDLLNIEVELSSCREEMAQWEHSVKSLQEILDQLTAAFTTAAGGVVGLATLDSSTVCDQELVSKKPENLDPKMKMACLSNAIAEVRKKLDAHKKNFDQLKEKEKSLLTELFQLRDIMTAAGCKVIIQPKPKENTASPTKPEKPALNSGFFDPSFEGFIEDMMALSVVSATLPKQDFTRFVGKWSGTTKVISSHEPSIVGATQPYVLEISATDSGISLKSSAGIIGNPAAYQTKKDGNHLRVDYSGPYVTPGLEQVQTTLTYWLDVTLNGSSLTGQSYTQANSSYEGQSTEKRFLMSIELKK